MKRSVFEFTGTVTPKEGEPYVQTFYVVAVGVLEGLTTLNKSNPKVPDMVFTGKSVQCNKDWDV